MKGRGDGDVNRVKRERQWIQEKSREHVVIGTEDLFETAVEDEGGDCGFLNHGAVKKVPVNNKKKLISLLL